MTITAQRSTGVEETLGAPLRWLVWRCETPARDEFGRRLSVSGRVQLRHAATRLLGSDPGTPGRDEHGRWVWPHLRLHGSVSTVPGLVSVALSTIGPVGVDIQDERHRPHAITWARRKLGAENSSRSIDLGDFSEIESLLKGAGLVDRQPETVQLPTWRPGWRPTPRGWWVRSSRLAELTAFASIVATAPRPVSIEGQP